MMTDTVEERIARIEGMLGIGGREFHLSRFVEHVAFGAVCTALCAGFAGAGLPNHYYQVLFAVLFLALAYHRTWILYGGHLVSVILAFSNTLLISIYLKIFLGAGYVQPFAWMQFPSVRSDKTEGVSSFMPGLSIDWQAASAAEFSIDLTMVQCFLLLISLIGGLFGFQPFASFTAFALVIVSLPTLLVFNWDWVLLSLVLGSVGLYLQTGTPRPRDRSL